MARNAPPDFSQMLSQFQVPGLDWQEFMLTQQRNIDALTRANQVMFEGAQAVMQRELEILQRAMEEASSSAQALMSETDPGSNAAKRVELAKAAFERAVENMREIAELAARSNEDALRVINQRVVEAMDEVHTAIGKAAPKR